MIAVYQHNGSITHVKQEIDMRDTVIILTHVRMMTVVSAQWQYQIQLGRGSAIEWFTITFDESAVVHLFTVATMTGHLFSLDRAFSIGIWSFVQLEIISHFEWRVDSQDTVWHVSFKNLLNRYYCLNILLLNLRRSL